MASLKDPCEPIRRRAARFLGVEQGLSCSQTSFKTSRASFLFIGPGAKGQGFKAMFKLDRSLPQAYELAAEEPKRFEVGKGGWVTTRFTTESPLPKRIWEKWLAESYELSNASGAKNARITVKKTASRNTTTKKSTKKKGDKSG